MPQFLISCEPNKPAARNQSKTRNTAIKRSNDKSELSARDKSAAEMAKHQRNFEIVMRCSNATPIRIFGGLGYACYFCSVQFRDPAHLKAHTMDNHQDFRLTPNKRGPQLNTYSVKLDITSLTCKLCLKPFEDLKLLMDHLRLDHAQPIHTDVKNYMMPVRFGSGPLKCVFCDTEFNVFKVLVDHMNVHFRNHVCKICDAGFVNRAAWRRHMREHETGEFPCNQCRKVFNSAVKLKNHTLSVHLKIKRNKCPYCFEKFNCLRAKNNHMEREHGVPLTIVKCNTCGRTFKYQSDLALHKRKYHLLEKRFKCTVCEKKFSSSSILKYHEVTHTGARDYKCDLCGKAFGRRSTLTQHKRIHADDRKYKCEHCQSAFVQKCSLKSHLNSVQQ